MTTRFLVSAALLLGTVALVGCSASISRSYAYEEVTVTASGPTNVHLYLSNQHSAPKSVVVLSAYVDGALTVRRSMPSVWADPNMPHGVPEEFPLHLPPGSHTIRVVAEGTGASAETQIAVGEAPVYVSAGYYAESCGDEASASGPCVTIHVLPERPGWV